MLRVKRRLRLFTSIVLPLIAAASYTNSHAETESIDLKALAKKARPAVMLLAVFDANGKEIATGTGFLVSSDGKLITNHHVIENAASAVAKAENGGMFPVEGVLADDPKNDLVLLKLKGKDLPFLTLGNSDKIEVGTRIAVIGSPLGLEGTLSEGIISAVRNLFGDQSWLQITAAISPGSSGSPVLNEKGQVIGVTTLLMRGGQSLNFAVPSETATSLLERAKSSTKLKPLVAAGAGSEDSESELWASPEMNATLAAEATEDWVAMLKAGKALVKRFPESPRAYYQLGFAYLSLKFYDDAIAACRQVIKLKPDDAGAWNSLGVIYFSQGKYEDSVSAVLSSTKLAPDNPEAWCTLGLAYKGQRKSGNAAAAFRKAIKLNPKHAGAWYGLGDACRDQQEFGEAIEAYHQAIKLEPYQIGPWQGLVFAHGSSTYGISDSTEKAKQFEMAEEALRQLERLDPEHARFADEWLSKIPR